MHNALPVFQSQRHSKPLNQKTASEVPRYSTHSMYMAATEAAKSWFRMVTLLCRTDKELEQLEVKSILGLLRSKS
ncbi:hypothetical protein BT93_K0248 [Corymbia citriodora subsp. variegata]|nr:hypothetical protein BT93_K0248 [Corymbia citriodora subsp. variegata]